jgi:predicted MFS family arabinose efflux permease
MAARPWFPNRNVGVLALAQFFGAFGQVATVLLAGLIGTRLAPDPALATVPVGTAVIGIAAATIPVGLALHRWGRRPVLLGGTLSSAAGCLLAALALQSADFVLYATATFVIGANLAFTAQYRFAAAETVAPEDASRAVTRVMLGTLGAALVSPWLAVTSRNWIGAEFTGSYLAMAAVFLLNFVTLLAWRDEPHAPAPQARSRRSIAEIARQPAFVVAAGAAAVAYGVMALLMTATPISMHVHDGHDVEETALVLQSHVIGMYAPSFLTGMLVARLGVTAMLAAGIVANAACALVALSGHGVAQYWAALTLLGVGWNLLFVAATTLLTRAYRPEERFRVQTANDFLMFAVMAAASLGAGPFMAHVGWRGLNQIALGVVAALAAALVVARRQARSVTHYT